MKLPHQSSSRRFIALLVMAFLLVVGGTWATVIVATGKLLDNYASTTAHSWARFLAENVGDLELIAAGEQPSAASLAFLSNTRRAANVFRYVIFNRDGYSQLSADSNRIALVDLSEFSAEAARAGAQGRPVIKIRPGGPGEPAQFAEAYVPAKIGTQTIAVVAASVDQTQIGRHVYDAFLFAAVALCALTAIAFALPAVALYRQMRRSRLADQRIRYLAHHDALTGLASRAA